MSSLPEVVGDAALSIDPGSQESMTEAMRKMYSDGKLREKFSRAGIERAKMFSWEKTTEKIVEFMRSNA